MQGIIYIFINIRSNIQINLLININKNSIDCLNALHTKYFNAFDAYKI